MRRVQWSRSNAIVQLRRDVWQYVTQAARTDDEIVLEAAALLQMPASDIRTLAQIHFVLSSEVRVLLEAMPTVVKRLTTTTANETETSTERIRGPIVWSETFAARAATGMPNAFVTAPTHRAYDTPENRLLAFALSAIAEMGRRTGWGRSSSESAGAEVRRRITEAQRWQSALPLRDVSTALPRRSDVNRTRTGRRRRQYEPAINVHALYERYIRRLDRAAIRTTVEKHALVVSRDSVLLELMSCFSVIRALRRQGWQAPTNSLLRTPLVFQGTRGNETVAVFYQHAPTALTTGSRYRKVQQDHAFKATGGLIPDLVLRYLGPQGVRWVLVEVKGVERPVEASARAAARDLFAYRRALSPVLSLQPEPYGIGIAWGADLEPVTTDEFVLCTPDRIDAALELVHP